jgi:hypothetical protein
MRSIDAGFRVTTIQDEIRDFIRSTPGPQIIFSTYHSSEKVANAALEEGVTFDLVICDEAHWLAGRVGKSYTSVLDEKLFPAHKRLFMTATPKVFSAAAKKTASNEGCLVSSMDDAAKFGAIAHQLSFAPAIKDGLLTDYQVVVAVTTNVEAKKLLTEKRFVSLDGTTMTANDLAAALAVAKAAERHNLARVISFHSSVKRSKGFVDAMKKVCSAKLPGLPQSLDAAHVDGSVSATERLRRLDHLKASTSGLNLLANARCLTEGIDVPSLDGVAFVDPRQSEVDITQAVGRAIRPSPNKKMGTIIIPVVMSDKEAAEGKLDASSHKKIRQVLWALRAHDSEIAIAIDNFVFGQASHTSGSRNLSTPEKIVIEFDGEKLKEFAENIRVCILRIGSPDAGWAERYSELEAFLDTHKRWPAQGADGGEREMTLWIGAQRQAFKKSTLSPERVKRLEELSGWSWDPMTDIWNQHFAAVKVFYDKHKRWPTNRGVGEEGVLGKWVHRQRRAFKKSALTSERIQLLGELPGWSWDPLTDKWDQNFEKVQAFCNKHKRGPAQKAAWEEGVLGKWIGAQRQAFKKSTLSPERVKQLEELPGWSWDPHAGKWEQNFEKVQAFHNKHKRWPMNSGVEEEGVLAKWTGQQRNAFKKSALTPERVKRLEELPGWSWDPHADTWDQNFAPTQVFHETHKRWPEHGAPGEEGVLAVWVGTQRQLFKKSALSSERVRRLEELPGWSWDPLADKWNQRFEKVQAFCTTHDRLPVRQALAEEAALAGWIKNQHQAWQRGRLSSECVLRLEELPGWSWDPPVRKWDQRFEKVQAFRNNHKRDPAQRAKGEEGILGKWVSAQRLAWLKSALSSERIQRLEALPGWLWDPLMDAWDQNFAAVQAFTDEHKRWPEHGADGEEATLARWVGTQRQAFKKSALSSERARRLVELPGWSWYPLTDKWNQRFEKVQAVCATHDRLPARQSLGEDAVLARWVKTQRRAWKKGILPTEHVQRLEELPGWSWDPHADTWDQNFEKIRKFRNDYKRGPAQKAAGEEGVLGKWIGAQRQAFKKSTLSPERVKRLEELSGWSWDPLTDAWDQNFAAVQAFTDEHKRWPVHEASVEEGVLGKWIGAQRQAFKKGALSSERVKRLEELSGWSWDPLTDAWDQNFGEVQAFRDKHKRWASHGAAGEEAVLAQWTGAQRQAFKKGALSSERIQRLEELSGWSWNLYADTWAQNFAAVQVFHDQHKRWPAYEAAGGEEVLARWIGAQRRAFKKSALSSERTTRLNSISGWTWSANEQPTDCVLEVSA